LSDCDHKFMGVGQCVRCGRSEASIYSEAYTDSLKVLSQMGKEAEAKDKRIAFLEASARDSEAAHKGWWDISQQKLAEQAACIAEWERRWEESPYPAAAVADEQIRALRAQVTELRATVRNLTQSIALGRVTGNVQI
jgi:hypothetical protein